MKYRLWIAPILLSAACLPALAAGSRTITIDDLGGIAYIGAPVVSSDGRYVAYTFEDQIHIVNSRGGESRTVTSESSSAWDPQWSKDGKTLYFVSDRSGTNQVWKLPLQTFGEAVPVTESARAITSIRLSPDESRLLVNWDDEPAEKTPAKEGEEADADEGPGPWVINRLQFKEDAGQGYLTAPPSDHFYTIEVASGELTQVTGGRYAETEGDWSPDGTELVFVSSREEDPDVGYRSDLWVVSSTPADPENPELRRLTDSEDVKDSPAFSPDGKQVAYLSAEDGVYGISRLAIIPAAGGKPTYLTTGLDRWVADFAFSRDGSWIWFTYDNEGARHLARVRVRDGKLERVLEGNVAVSAFDVDASGNVFVRANRENDAADLYRVDHGRLERLTDVNHDFFAEVRLGEKESVSFTSTGDVDVQAFVVKPPDFEKGRRYPTVLDIHGGPVGQYSWGYDFGAQYLASRGYVVVQPNPRGSTGRGQDFIRAIFATWGETDYDDVVGAVDRVIELGYADPEALAVTGYSYGGYMTNVVITRTTRFKAAASGAGHSFIAANFGHDIYQRWYSWELGVPWENREKYDRLSPLLRVAEVETPTIFLGGRQDWNVPILNAELFYQALRKRGVDTQLVVYPGAHHGGWEERFDKDYLERVVAWFDRYAKNKGN